jgi:cobyrinic acid a,c-diamide synthase
MPASGWQAAPRLVIAAPQGRSGKTTVSLGLCAALAARGLTVQPFKKGPDYIDPSWLSAAAGRPCRSLDPFFYPDPEDLRHAFTRAAIPDGISLVEGNHGLYDSGASDSDDVEGLGSTAAVSRTLKAPIVLVVNAAAMVRGYQTFEPETNIAAVILNNTVPGRHQERLRSAIERHCRIPVAGCLPRWEELAIPDRHLGLVPQGENDSAARSIAACRGAAEQYLDLDLLLELARSAPQLPEHAAITPGEMRSRPAGRQPAIGIIRDRAFSFYYPENLEALAAAGACLVSVDSLNDRQLPDIQALYIGGGFPEIFMDELAANRSLLSSLRTAVEAGLPVYAECGGLMYLSQTICWGDRSAHMAGVLPCQVELTGKPQGHGYVQAETSGKDPFFPAFTQLRGHEFHHSKVAGCQYSLRTAYRLTRGSGLGGRRDGLMYKNVLAGYTHIHAAGAPDWAPGLVSRATHYMEGRPYA